MVGPEASLHAVAGENLILPCFIKPNTSVVDMTVEWLRLEEMTSLVHLYRDHEDRYEDQAQSYRGRTSLFKEELQKGNASLKLSPVRVSDEGKYKCLIEDKSWYDDIIVHIMVEASELQREKQKAASELQKVEEHAEFLKKKLTLGMVVVCVTLLIFYSFMESQSEQLKLVGPQGSLDAVAGENLVLPCFIKPNTSAVDMTVEWLRLEEVTSLVHLYRDHEDRYEDQAQSYRGRTLLFKEELQKGNASLILSPVRVSDEGKYKCLIHDKSWYDDITFQIMVEAQGSHPVIMMESYDNSGGVNLVCESRGWKPEPDVLWLNRDGDILPAEETQRHRETEGFSVKRRITVHDYSDSNRFYCRLQQQHHMIEAEVIITSKVFAAWKWDVGISVSACLIAVGAIIIAVICYKKELQRQRQKAASELQREKRKAASELQKVEEYAELQRRNVED
ncbi:butyrophilin subfamily 1 member A1-like isoform X1, partial [Clarias magur]